MNPLRSTLHVLPNSEKDWLKVNRSALNVFSKQGDLPDVKNDLRLGKVVEVTVRESPGDARYDLKADPRV